MPRPKEKDLNRYVVVTDRGSETSNYDALREYENCADEVEAINTMCGACEIPNLTRHQHHFRAYLVGSPEHKKLVAKMNGEELGADIAPPPKPSIAAAPAKKAKSADKPPVAKKA